MLCCTVNVVGNVNIFITVLLTYNNNTTNVLMIASTIWQILEAKCLSRNATEFVLMGFKGMTV